MPNTTPVQLTFEEINYLSDLIKWNLEDHPGDDEAFAEALREKLLAATTGGLR